MNTIITQAASGRQSSYAQHLFCSIPWPEVAAVLSYFHLVIHVQVVLRSSSPLPPLALPAAAGAARAPASLGAVGAAGTHTKIK
jgi:hypothetical protein